MKKLIIVLGAVALITAQYCAQASIILSGSTGLVSGNLPNPGDKLKIDYTVDLTGSTYTYSYTLSTSPAEALTSFTIGSSLVNLFTPTMVVQPGSPSGSFVGAYFVTFFFAGFTSGTVSYTSNFGPGLGVWGVNDASITWNNPPLIPVPVPEASTALAGLLMIAPLGIGAIRAIRKERVS